VVSNGPFSRIPNWRHNQRPESCSFSATGAQLGGRDTFLGVGTSPRVRWRNTLSANSSADVTTRRSDFRLCAGAQLDERDTFLGVGTNRLVRWDQRTAGGVVQEMSSPTVSYAGGKDYARNTNFNCMATSGAHPVITHDLLLLHGCLRCALAQHLDTKTLNPGNLGISTTDSYAGGKDHARNPNANCVAISSA